MASQYVKLTMPRQLYADGLELVKEFGYSNIQELTVESLRKQIIELKRHQALITLENNFGSVRAKKRLTKEQKEAIAEHSLQKAKGITKEFGLADIRI